MSYAAPWYQKEIDYFKFDGSITRLQDFTHRFLGYFRASYQYSPRDNIPVIDQMSVGGVGTVRGYSPFNIVLKATYGVPLKHNEYDNHHGDWNLELTFAPDFDKFFSR